MPDLDMMPSEQIKFVCCWWWCEERDLFHNF